MAQPIPQRRPHAVLAPVVLLFMLLSVAGFQPARACSCVRSAVHGFIHPDITVLPANAQGVLFHAPADLALTPAMFAVSSPAHAAPQRIRIAPVDLPAGHPMRSRLPDGGRLVRVGIEGGFAAGARYAIRYREDALPLAAARSHVEFDVDRRPLDLSALRFDIELDGPARRTMLPMAANGGMCSVSAPAMTQAFHVRIPAGLQRYAPALGLLSEARDAIPGAAFTPLRYRPTLCTPVLFDRTAHGAGNDMLIRDCRAGPGRVHLRTWIGMLEVSDTFVLAAPASIDLAPAGAQSCSPFGMLRDAVERNDAGEAAHLSCQLGSEGDLALRSLDTDTEPVPTREQWSALARQADTRAAGCARAAMQRMLLMARQASPELVETYVTLAREALRERDQAAVAATLDQLDDLARTWRRHRHESASGPSASTLLPMLPDLLDLAKAGGPGASTALGLIGGFGPAARATAPELMRLADGETPEAAAAVRALQSVIPDDPAFHRSLLAWGQRPALRESAALAFRRVAGATQPEAAIALLLPLAREDNVLAIDALADLGPAAASSTAALLARLDHAPDGYVRARLLRALMQVAPDEAAVVDVLSRALLGPPNLSLASSDYAGLRRFTRHATALVPVIEHLIAAVRSPHEQDGLRTLIGGMALAPAQKTALLGKLAQCTVPL